MLRLMDKNKSLCVLKVIPHLPIFLNFEMALLVIAYFYVVLPFTPRIKGFGVTFRNDRFTRSVIHLLEQWSAM